MSKVKTPLFSQEAHGALGGIEFRTSTYGNIVGRRSITPHRRTPAQTTHRALLQQASSAWRDSTAKNKSAWSAFAVPPMDGRTAYIGAYIRLVHHGILPSENPNTPTETFDLRNFVISHATKDPPLIVLEWENTLSESTLLNISAVATFSNRKSHTHNRLPFRTHAVAWEEFSPIYLPNWAPVVHIRIDAIHDYNGAIIASWTMREEPDWT